MADTCNNYISFGLQTLAYTANWRHNFACYEVPTYTYEQFVTQLQTEYDNACIKDRVFYDYSAKLLQQCFSGGSGGMTSFTVEGDNGTPFTITNGETLDFEGSTGIDIGVSDPKVLVAIDYSGIDSFIMAAGNGTSITVDGANDKLVIYDNDAAAVKYINANQLPGGSTTEVYWSANTDGTISNSGLTDTKVGIGTDKPNEELTVVGEISGTSNLHIGGDTYVASDVYTDQLRRFTDNSTTTKINLSSGNIIKLFAGNSSNERVKISSSEVLMSGITRMENSRINGNLGVTGNTSVSGDILQPGVNSIFNNGNYLEIGTGFANAAQLTFNANHDGGVSTNTYTPVFAGNSNAGMTVIKMPSGGHGGLEFYVKNHGTTSGSQNLSTFTKILDLNQDGDSTFSGRILVGTIDAAGASYSNDKILVAQSDGEVEYLTKEQLREDISAGYWSATTTGGHIVNSGLTSNVGIGTDTGIDARLSLGKAINTDDYKIILVGEESCTVNHVWTTMDSNTSKYKLMVGERTTSDDDTSVNMIISPTTDDASSPPVKFGNLVLGAYTRGESCPQEMMRITSSGVGIKTSSPAYALDVTGDISASGTIYAASKVEHLGDSNTYIQFADDSIGITAGGEQLITISESPTFVKIGDGGDVDFQVRTNSDDNTLYVLGETDKVGIGTNTPNEKLTVVGAISGNSSVTAGSAGFIVGNATLTTSELDISSGNFTLDVEGDITIDANGADVILSDNGTDFGRFKRDTSDFVIKAETADKDIILKGIDDSTTIAALTLDMSEAGAAIFNDKITAGANPVNEMDVVTKNYLTGGTIYSTQIITFLGNQNASPNKQAWTTVSPSGISNHGWTKNLFSDTALSTDATSTSIGSVAYIGRTDSNAGIIVPDSAILVGFRAYGRNASGNRAWQVGLFCGKPTYGSTSAFQPTTGMTLEAFAEATSTGSFANRPNQAVDLTRSHVLAPGDVIWPAIKATTAADNVPVSFSVVLKIPITT